MSLHKSIVGVGGVAVASLFIFISFVSAQQSVSVPAATSPVPSAATPEDAVTPRFTLNTTLGGVTSTTLSPNTAFSVSHSVTANPAIDRTGNARNFRPLATLITVATNHDAYTSGFVLGVAFDANDIEFEGLQFPYISNEGDDFSTLDPLLLGTAGDGLWSRSAGDAGPMDAPTGDYTHSYQKSFTTPETGLFVLDLFITASLCWEVIMKLVKNCHFSSGKGK